MSPEDDAAKALDRAERRGLGFAIAIRSVLLVAMALFSIFSQVWPQGLIGAAFMAVFMVLGLGFLRLIQAERDRHWMRYAFFACDAAILSIAAIHAPLSTGGDVPQIFVFRVFGVDAIYFVLATSTLSLSPRLVMWAGAAAVSGLWISWGIIVAGMERTVSWSDLPASAPTETFMAVFLDPDFIARGSRVIDTFLIIATATVMAAAVGRARSLLRSQMAAERARGRVAEVFGRFVPAEIAENLAQSGGDLAPAKREATVLIVDVEGFTSFAARTSPDRVVAVLDSFFDGVSQVVSRHRGVVISLIGDAALVAFNAPLDNPEHGASGLAAAQDLLEMAETREFAGERLAVRIGVASGPVAAGTVGGQGRRA
ncbi:MAG: adenylate/guanylate cyclase domain-containing protein, partial [Pseudomonadota bacterium]